MDTIWCRDGISISNLALINLQSATLDAWSRRKSQPISLTLRLSLFAPFTTAAATDTLDTSTLHYGQLSKALSSLPPATQWETLDSLAHRLADRVLSPAIESAILTLKLPKASLLGEGVHYTLILPSGRPTERTLHLSRLALPVLVGLNPHERTRRQPLLISVWIIDLPASTSDSAAAIEAVIENAVRDTAFETLEALVSEAVTAVESNFMATHASNATLRIRIEKPLAVGWAEAPAVEVVRTKEERTISRGQRKGASHRLEIYRPYIRKSHEA